MKRRILCRAVKRVLWGCFRLTSGGHGAGTERGWGHGSLLALDLSESQGSGKLSLVIRGPNRCSACSPPASGHHVLRARSVLEDQQSTANSRGAECAQPAPLP